MIKKIREKMNSYRLDFISLKRKKKIQSETNLEQVSHLIPTVSCPHVWYGNSYGGFYVNPNLLNPNSIVYSIGIGKDISFDLKIMENHNSLIFGFDPTPKSIDFISSQNLSNRFIFSNVGISMKSGIETFYLPISEKGISGSLLNTSAVDVNRAILVEMKSFEDIYKDLQHDHIDVIKIDIEGAEYEILEAIINSDIQIDQILVEFHDRLFDMTKFKSIDIVNKMKEKGYQIFASSISYEEISFIHQNKLV